MQKMIVKNVDLMGNTVMAAQDSEGIIWVGVRWICDGLDMTEGQMKRQIKNIKNDMLFSKGGANQIPLPTNSGKQDVFCIKLDFIPLWLAKISITDKTRKERPEFAEKLLDYQLKAKDILAEAFLPKQEPPTSVAGQIQLLAQGNVELNKRVDEVQDKTDKLAERFDKFEKELPLMPNEADLLREAVNKRVMHILGGKESKAYKNRSIVNTIFGDAYRNLKRNFDVRKYNCIKRSQIEIALKIAEEYVPPVYLAELIQQENAQRKLDLK